MKRLSLEVRIGLLKLLDRLFLPARQEMQRRWEQTPEGKAVQDELDAMVGGWKFVNARPLENSLGTLRANGSTPLMERANSATDCGGAAFTITTHLQSEAARTDLGGAIRKAIEESITSSAAPPRPRV